MDTNVTIVLVLLVFGSIIIVLAARTRRFRGLLNVLGLKISAEGDSGPGNVLRSRKSRIRNVIQSVEGSGRNVATFNDDNVDGVLQETKSSDQIVHMPEPKEG